MKKTWTEEAIERAINEVRNVWLIERMPSRAEVEAFYGDASVSNAIMKTGGFYYWAEKLGLETKDSESKFGVEIETQIKDALEGMRFKCETTGMRHPYDLLVDDCVKIDVKAARITKVRGSDVYSFRIAKPQQTCDVYVAVCVGDKNEILQTYVIPAIIMSGKKQLCMGAEHSSYDEYLDRWDIIEKLSEAFHQIV